MKAQLYFTTIICIIILICSSCSITRQTTCPTFTNKTEKAHKPLFAKKHSPKKEKKQLAKIAKQAKKKDTGNISFSKIESIISQINVTDLTALSENNIALNINDAAPNTNDVAIISSNNITPPKQSKLQKFIYKRIEKKSEKILKKIKKNIQKRKEKERENCESIISQKEHKVKLKKIFSSKNNDSINKPENHILAILSLIAGIATFLFLLSIPGLGLGALALSVINGILAIVFGAIAGSKIKKNPRKYRGKGMARTGFILGIIPLGIIILLVLILIILFLSGAIIPVGD